MGDIRLYMYNKKFRYQREWVTYIHELFQQMGDASPYTEIDIDRKGNLCYSGWLEFSGVNQPVRVVLRPERCRLGIYWLHHSARVSVKKSLMFNRFYVIERTLEASQGWW